MRIFVTGGAGFVGSHTAAHLLAHGLDVRLYDDLSTGSLENLRRLEEREQFVRGDVTDRATLRAAMRGCDAVLHLAGDEPARVEPVLDVAAALGVGRVVVAGAPATWEGVAIAVPPDLRPIWLRYAHVYGPRQHPRSPHGRLIGRYVEAVLARRPLPLPGPRDGAADYVYVQDVAAANRLALLAPADLDGEVVDVGTGRLVGAREVFARAVALAGGDPAPGPAFARRASPADLARTRALLGFVPRVPFEEGLALTMAWARRKATSPAFAVTIRHVGARAARYASA